MGADRRVSRMLDEVKRETIQLPSVAPHFPFTLFSQS